MASCDATLRMLAGLQGLGYDFFAGVPCSLIGDVQEACLQSGVCYYPAAREDLAIGLAAGACLAGRRPVVFMQNSGLGLCVNALFSLTKMYGMSLLIVVTWRGETVDAPEHLDMGRALLPLLEILGIPFMLISSPQSYAPEFHNQAGPIALVVRRGDMEPSHAST